LEEGFRFGVTLLDAKKEFDNDRDWIAWCSEIYDIEERHVYRDAASAEYFQKYPEDLKFFSGRMSLSAVQNVIGMEPDDPALIYIRRILEQDPERRLTYREVADIKRNPPPLEEPKPEEEPEEDAKPSDDIEQIRLEYIAHIQTLDLENLRQYTECLIDSYIAEMDEHLLTKSVNEKLEQRIKELEQRIKELEQRIKELEG
jgi:predicted ribosome quality control (RQC) complex YloA/Tae2 family protein